MADKLPRIMVIKSLASGQGYAYYQKEAEKAHGYIYCKEGSAFSPLTKIEVEESTTHTNCVHLRFSHSNKYWAKCPNDYWIIATAAQPEEDVSKPSCTLFEPSIDGDGHLRTHLQSEQHVRADNTACVYVSDTYQSAFKVVDWNALVKLPRARDFKRDNNMYLQGVWCEGHEYLQFSGEDSNAESVSYEVVLNPDGYLRIKSGYFGKFWRLSPGWIWADSSDVTSDNADTLFWPVKVDDHTIALRSAGNKKFCKCLTADGKTGCLNATVGSITNEAKQVVEELVLERSIYNVRYHMEDSRIFDEETFLAGHELVDNEGDLESSGDFKISYVDKISHSFDYSLSIAVGAKATITTGIPCIVEGKIEISTEVTNSFQWGTATEQSIGAEASCAVKIPPRSRVRIDYVGTRGMCSIPFSYTQKDKRSGDGAYVASNHIDGIFIGVNYYSFRFVQHAAEPL